jgi:hypothetical protein
MLGSRHLAQPIPDAERGARRGSRAAVSRNREFQVRIRIDVSQVYFPIPFRVVTQIRQLPGIFVVGSVRRDSRRKTR